jgi:hypothetical protein
MYPTLYRALYGALYWAQEHQLPRRSALPRVADQVVILLDSLTEAQVSELMAVALLAVCARVRVRVRACVHACARVRACACACVCVGVCVHVCVCACMWICLRRKSACVCVSMGVRVCLCKRSHAGARSCAHARAWVVPCAYVCTAHTA